MMPVDCDSPDIEARWRGTDGPNTQGFKTYSLCKGEATLEGKGTIF